MEQYVPEAGDIAACWGADWSSRFISGITAWPFSPPGLMLGPSHVAIMAPLQLGLNTPVSKSLFWCESTTMTGTPCVVNGKMINGVQAHYPKTRIEEYKKAGGSVVIYRLHKDRRFDAEDIQDISVLLIEKIVDEIGYDLDSALLSGARISARVLSLFGIHDDDVFCSDLVATCLKKVGLLNQNIASSLYTPAGLLRTLTRSLNYERHMKL